MSISRFLSNSFTNFLYEKLFKQPGPYKGFIDFGPKFETKKIQGKNEIVYFPSDKSNGSDGPKIVSKMEAYKIFFDYLKITYIN